MASENISAYWRTTLHPSSTAQPVAESHLSGASPMEKPRCPPASLTILPAAVALPLGLFIFWEDQIPTPCFQSARKHPVSLIASPPKRR